ncbi:unnamed protein product [Bursaphelenchus okinawaensis]|uniref:Uncharacterized protein n=1 Tax=Bursaphelenchus okinawaensis TaxID=465554 RepID=A0A811LVW9_9BILA|nr:unnamed protein product [Bursaphelenchus okinawaensis]CAG9128546.1 unnamed protein product [Bursaphelenchus okinawaensis]
MPPKKKSTTRRRRGNRTPTNRRRSTLDEDANTVVSVEEADERSNSAPKGCTDTELLAAVTPFVEKLEKTTLEQFKEEYAALKAIPLSEATFTAFEANRPKNRYTDQFCIDQTRVKLTFNVPPDSDYIHANHVNVEGHSYNMICTQGPVQSSVADFWRMVYQEKCFAIVMLCKFIEGKRPKCEPYYPDEAGKIETYGPLMVRHGGPAPGSDRSYEKLVLDVGRVGEPFVPEHTVILVSYDKWPDKSVPTSSMALHRVLRFLRTQAKDKTIVVHCSAGVGRTGTFAALSVVESRISEKKAFDVFEIVKNLRQKRFNSVQTEIQYLFIHKAIADYLNAKKIRTDKFNAMYFAHTRGQPITEG